MAVALDIAKFFLSNVDRENGDVMTHLKLQKLVYYAQAWSLVLRGHELFDGAIEAWVNGPVCPQVWSEYKMYPDKTPIPRPDNFTEKLLSKDELNLLNLITNTYGNFTASKLWKLSHTEYPWRDARRGIAKDCSSRQVILPELMKEYYSNFVDICSKSIHNEVFLEQKDVDSVITLNDKGKSIQIRTNDLYQYFKSSNNESDKVKVKLKRPMLDGVGN